MIDTGCAQRLKEAREKKGLSRADVADAIATSYFCIMKYETAQRCPQLYMLDALADLYDVTLDWLCGR